MPAIVLICQIIALACFFISWMAWTIPAPPRRAWYWLAGGFFWLLLSFMIGHVSLDLHPVH